VAPLQDCVGELVPPNQVVYQGAFGPLADIRLTYTKAAVESDLILLQQPHLPEGWDPETTRLELWHEWHGTPSPRQTTRPIYRETDEALRQKMLDPDMEDQILDFGDLWFPTGAAFSTDAASVREMNEAARVHVPDFGVNTGLLPVAKTWLTAGHRSVLVESLRWADVLPELQRLPLADQARLYTDVQDRLACLNRLPPPPVASKTAAAIQLAQSPYIRTGFVLDYITISGTGNYTFNTGITYYVAAASYGAATLTFQPGCVIKFAPDASLRALWTVACNGSSASPSILTSKDDDLFGVVLPSSTHNPTYTANPAVGDYYSSSPSGCVFRGMKIRWAKTGVQFVTTSTGNSVWDTSLEFCQTGVSGGTSGRATVVANICSVQTPCSSYYGLLTCNITDICTGDADQNGLPDLWEYWYFGQTGVNPNADSDGDLLSNSAEYAWGTNPLNAHTMNQTKTDAEYHLSAIMGEAGTRVELDVEANYDPQADVTHLDCMIWVTGADDFYDILLYGSGGEYWQNTGAHYWRSVPWGGGYVDFYVGTLPGDVTSASFAAFHNSDFDYDGLPDGYEVKVMGTASGNPDSDNDGIADGDEDADLDGLTLAQESRYGTNPNLAEGNQDSDGDGLPDWLEELIRRRLIGIGDFGPWDDSDGDGVPNVVEFEIGSDPTFQDFGASFPPPPLEDAEVVSLEYSVSYTDSQGPQGNSYFTTAGFCLGPLGVTVGMTAIPSDFGGPGVADVRFDIMPVQAFYDNVWPFTDDGAPTQFEVQRPDPDDATSYRALISLATSLSGKLWGQINEPLLQALRQRTLEYVSCTTKMKISYACREIQWLEYQRLSLGANHPGLLLRIQHRASVIHTEMTKSTAIHMEYVDRYPTDGLRYVGKVLKGVQWLSFAVKLPDNLQQLRERIFDYLKDVELHRDTAGPALLSLQLQAFISSIPGMPGGLISTTTPIFDPCPLGFYEGGGGSWEDCLWPY